MRRNSSDSGHYISLCSALANNPHGFPGHCFITVGTANDYNYYSSSSCGFGPARGEDQIPSLWSSVKGLKCHDIVAGNTRNLDRLTLILDSQQYQRYLTATQEWHDGWFKVGSRDCVAFTDSIARALGLHTPTREYKFPQDYIRELKLLN